MVPQTGWSLFPSLPLPLVIFISLSLCHMILGSSKPVTCALHRHSAPYRGTFRRGNSSVHVSVKPERRTRELAFTVASLSPKDEGGEQRTESMYFDNVPSKSGRVGKGVNLFDPAATASRFITRRFGLVGGLTFCRAACFRRRWRDSQGSSRTGRRRFG